MSYTYAIGKSLYILIFEIKFKSRKADLNENGIKLQENAVTLMNTYLLGILDLPMLEESIFQKKNHLALIVQDLFIFS